MPKPWWFVICTLHLIPAWSQEKTPQTRLEEAAQRIVQAINATDYEGLRNDFNQPLQEALPEQKCKTFFKTSITEKFGNINSLELLRRLSDRGAIFLLHAEQGTLEFTLSLDETGRIAGMRFRPRENFQAPEHNLTPLTLPFHGRWLVFWGGDTPELNHHHDDRAQRFAFDFLGVGPDGQTFRGDGTRNEDYYAFGRDVLAPADGIVIEVIEGVRDNTPGSMNPYAALGNAVFIQHSPHEVSVLAHFQQGSIQVKVGDRVQQGQTLGRCGNSGHSSEPHLHYHLQHTAVIQDAVGIKCFFKDVVVEDRQGRSLRPTYSPIKGDIVSSAP